MPLIDLVFEGGGAKGSVFAGALEVLFKEGHRPGRVVGTSAGAITAALLGAGYSPGEMLAAVGEQRDGKPRFATFMDIAAASALNADTGQFRRIMDTVQFSAADLGLSSWLSGALQPVNDAVRRLLLQQLLGRSPHFRQIFSFVEEGGIYSGNTFVEWVHEKLAAKGLERGITFARFHEKTRADVSLVATDTANREMLVLNHRTAPPLPVAMAVRMSMSIPFLWCEVTWKPEWGTYIGRDKTRATVVDGGVLSNFPIDLIATDRAPEIMGENRAGEALIMGLLIDETLEVPGIVPNPSRTPSLATVARIQRLVDTMTGARDQALMTQYAAFICRLPAKGYGTTEFDMPAPKIGALVEAGRNAMRDHLRGRGLLAATIPAGV